jgi:hypothetical protein
VGRAEAQFYSTEIFDDDGNVLRCTTVPAKTLWGLPLEEDTQAILHELGAKSIRPLKNGFPAISWVEPSRSAFS